MKYIFYIISVILILFFIYVGMAVYYTKQGYMNSCMHKLEACIMGDNEKVKRGLINTIRCSNKVFVCNAGVIYRIFFDSEALEKEYNDYMNSLLKKEIELEKAIEKEKEIFRKSYDKEDDPDEECGIECELGL